MSYTFLYWKHFALFLFLTRFPKINVDLCSVDRLSFGFVEAVCKLRHVLGEEEGWGIFDIPNTKKKCFAWKICDMGYRGRKSNFLRDVIYERLHKVVRFLGVRRVWDFVTGQTKKIFFIEILWQRGEGVWKVVFLRYVISEQPLKKIFFT